MDTSNSNFNSDLLHSNRHQKAESGAIHQPIHPAVAYSYERAEDLVAVFQGKQKGYAYARQSNPTNTFLEEKISLLEEANHTVSFATGMATIGSLFFSLLKKGDHVIVSQYLFANTHSLFNSFIRLGIDIDFVDATSGEEVIKATTKKTKLIFVETIANPKTEISDLKTIGKFCEENKIIFVVDNTVTSTALFKPKHVKATFSINSLSKYLSGHGNVLGGSISDLGNHNWLEEENILSNYRKVDSGLQGIWQIKKKGIRDFGATLSSFNAHLISAGMDTLFLRMSKQCENAKQLARFLNDHPKVEKVYHPSLPHHSQYDRCQELFSHAGAVLSFELKKDIDIFSFLNKLKYFALSSHLGDNRCLIIPIAQTIYYELGKDTRKALGINDNLIRLSCGIEEIEDLKKDIDRALSL